MKKRFRLRGFRCTCKSEDRNWEVTQYRVSHSAFNGYRVAPSNYSSVVCHTCQRAWRTKAKYVEELRREPCRTK